MQDLQNGWRHYLAQDLPPLGTFLAYVESEPMIYIALRETDWQKPRFWNGTEWLLFTKLVTAWQALPMRPVTA